MTDFFSDISGIFDSVDSFFEGTVDFLSDAGGSLLGEKDSAWNSILRGGAEFFGTTDMQKRTQKSATDKLHSGLLSAAAVGEISPSKSRSKAGSANFQESVSPQNLDAFWIQRMAKIAKG